MIVLYIILAVLVLLFASLVLPIRLSLRLVNDNFTLSLKILGIRYRLHPAKRRTKPSKERKQKKAGQQPATEQGSVAGELRDLLSAAIPRIPKVFGAISVPKFRLRLRIAAEDPAKCAELFGAVCAAFGLFWHQLDRVFTFRRPRIDIEPDFDEKRTQVILYADIRSCAIKLLFAAMPILISYLKRKIQISGGKTK